MGATTAPRRLRRCTPTRNGDAAVDETGLGSHMSGIQKSPRARTQKARLHKATTKTRSAQMNGCFNSPGRAAAIDSYSSIKPPRAAIASDARDFNLA